jgi:hypothetical protein
LEQHRLEVHRLSYNQTLGVLELQCLQVHLAFSKLMALILDYRSYLYFLSLKITGIKTEYELDEQEKRSFHEFI